MCKFFFAHAVLYACCSVVGCANSFLHTRFCCSVCSYETSCTPYFSYYKIWSSFFIVIRGQRYENVIINSDSDYSRV